MKQKSDKSDRCNVCRDNGYYIKGGDKIWCESCGGKPPSKEVAKCMGCNGTGRITKRVGNNTSEIDCHLCKKPSPPSHKNCPVCGDGIYGTGEKCKMPSKEVEQCKCEPSPFGDSLIRKVDGLYCPQCGKRREETRCNCGQGWDNHDPEKCIKFSPNTYPPEKLEKRNTLKDGLENLIYETMEIPYEYSLSLNDTRKLASAIQTFIAGVLPKERIRDYSGSGNTEWVHEELRKEGWNACLNQLKENLGIKGDLT